MMMMMMMWNCCCCCCCCSVWQRTHESFVIRLAQRWSRDTAETGDVID